jgi:hypothetical protein
VFSDSETNKTVVSFIPEVFRCPDGTYSSSQSFREVHRFQIGICYYSFWQQSYLRL